LAIVGTFFVSYAMLLPLVSKSCIDAKRILSRENWQADMLDHHLMEILFPLSCTGLLDEVGNFFYELVLQVKHKDR